jgi:hypothetical protein
MKNSNKKLNVLLLAAVCLFAGCAQTQRQGTTGFPVRVGIQDSNGLPVELRTNKPIPVEAKLNIDEKIPVELVIEKSKPLPVEAKIQAEQTLPVNAKIQAEETLPVKLIPDRAIWIMVAIACLMTFFTMIAAIASCRAAINAKRAAEKQSK